jgi:Lar family restriction alleviation protein
VSQQTNPIPLLPCPWCGSEEVSLADFNDDDINLDCNYDAVRCNHEGCGAVGPIFHQDEAAAIAAWNKGPYADRYEIHAKALTAHADRLKAEAAEHIKKAEELLAKIEVST